MHLAGRVNLANVGGLAAISARVGLRHGEQVPRFHGGTRQSYRHNSRGTVRPEGLGRSQSAMNDIARRSLRMPGTPHRHRSRTRCKFPGDRLPAEFGDFDRGRFDHLTLGHGVVLQCIECSRHRSGRGIMARAKRVG